MSRTDTSLLKSFQLHRDEESFSILYKRYSGLVYHCAFRKTQSHSLAEEITQKVFCSLAQKTSLFTSRSAHLPALLHRAAVYEASKALRTEVRHQRRKDAYMKAKDAELNEDTSLWQDILPHLDQALDRLTQSERSILLLHYLNGLSFPVISSQIGKSAAAVQKQSRRALLKLSKHLRHKGITLSVVALGQGLSSELSKASPIQFSPDIIFNPSSLPVHSFTHTAKLVLTAKIKYWASVAVFVFCSIPLLYQWRDIRNLHNENSLLQNQLSSAPGKSSNESRYPSRKRLSAVSKGLPGKLTLSDLEYLTEVIFAYEIQNDDPYAGLLARKQINEGTPEQILELLKLSPELIIEKEKREYMVMVLFRELLGSDFTMALSEGLTAVAENHLSDLFAMRSLIDREIVLAYRDWLKRDPEEAQRWLVNQESSGVLTHKGLGFGMPFNDTLRKELMSYLLRNQDLSGTVEFLQMISESERANVLIKYFESLGTENSEMPKNQKSMVAQLTRQSFSPEKKLEMFGKLGSILGIEKTPNFIGKAEFSQREKIEVLMGAARTHLRVMIGQSSRGQVEINLSHLLPLQNWFAAVEPGQHHFLLGKSLGRFTQDFHQNRLYRESLEEFFRIYPNGETFLGFLDGLEEGVNPHEVQGLQGLTRLIEDLDLRIQAIKRISDFNKQ